MEFLLEICINKYWLRGFACQTETVQKGDSPSGVGEARKMGIDRMIRMSYHSFVSVMIPMNSCSLTIVVKKHT